MTVPWSVKISSFQNWFKTLKSICTGECRPANYEYWMKGQNEILWIFVERQSIETQDNVDWDQYSSTITKALKKKLVNMDWIRKQTNEIKCDFPFNRSRSSIYSVKTELKYSLFIVHRIHWWGRPSYWNKQQSTIQVMRSKEKTEKGKQFSMEG